jgi:hypothetical protein
MRRRAGTAALAALLATGVAACGSTVSTGSFAGESHAVAQRVAALQSALSTGEAQKLCREDLARAVQTRLRAAGSSCEAALKRQLTAIDDYELAVQSIAIHGAEATATVRSTFSGKLHTSTVELVKEGGAWKVAAIK